jgi:hypothetical protein
MSDGIWMYTYCYTRAIESKTCIGAVEVWQYEYDHNNQMVRVEQILDGVSVVVLMHLKRRTVFGGC